MTARLIRPLERAACAVVGIDPADLWQRRTQAAILARGIVVYAITKTTPLTVADVAELKGMDPRRLDEARSRVARRAFHCDATRRALWDVAASVKTDPARLVPPKMERVLA